MAGLERETSHTGQREAISRSHIDHSATEVLIHAGGRQPVRVQVHHHGQAFENALGCLRLIVVGVPIKYIK